MGGVGDRIFAKGKELLASESYSGMFMELEKIFKAL